MKRLFQFWAGSLWLCAAAAWSAPEVPSIRYDAASNVIWVAGYPEENPATLDDVFKADQQGRWGKVAYSAASDTYTMKASLWIGNDRNGGTFFQIGRTNHPRETLIIAGDVWVCAPKKSGARIANRVVAGYIVNRLTVGDPGNASIRPAIKFDCTAQVPQGLYVGAANRDHGGDLYLYHATVTAAAPDKEHRWKGYSYGGGKGGLPGGWWCARLHVVDSTIAWVGGGLVLAPVTMGKSMADSNLIVDRAAIEDCDSVRIFAVFPDKYQPMTVPLSIPLCLIKNSAFRRCGIVSAAHWTTFVNCTFESNRQNMAFETMPGVKIALVDCDLKPQAEPLKMPKVVPTPEQVKSGRIPNDCSLHDLITLVCRVVDRKGKPVPCALVCVDCAADPGAVHRGITVTGMDGLTPADVEKNALLITRRLVLPSDDPAKPAETNYRYTVTVSAAGHKTQSVEVDGKAPVARPLVIRL